ncbi:Down syndrome cell adhesion molecule [Nymphon striatum]|nr:Down syndrome cell adhesion molecule [Nymphon striatum]
MSLGVYYINLLVKPQISPMALPKHILEGMQVVIFCSVVRGDQPVKKVWLKDGQPIPSQLGIIIGDNPVYSALEVKSVESIHTGNYTCTASNIAGMTSTTVQLLVEAPPMWEIVPEDKLVYPGDKVQFDCKGGGTPKPVSTWRMLIDGVYEDLPRNPRYELLKNGSLVITSLIEKDETTYICEIRNGLDPGISKRVKLQFGMENLPQNLKREALSDRELFYELK